MSKKNKTQQPANNAPDNNLVKAVALSKDIRAQIDLIIQGNRDFTGLMDARDMALLYRKEGNKYVNEFIGDGLFVEYFANSADVVGFLNSLEKLLEKHDSDESIYAVPNFDNLFSVEIKSSIEVIDTSVNAVSVDDDLLAEDVAKHIQKNAKDESAEEVKAEQPKASNSNKSEKTNAKLNPNEDPEFKDIHPFIRPLLFSYRCKYGEPLAEIEEFAKKEEELTKQEKEAQAKADTKQTESKEESTDASKDEKKKGRKIWPWVAAAAVVATGGVALYAMGGKSNSKGSSYAG